VTARRLRYNRILVTVFPRAVVTASIFKRSGSSGCPER
jgi:hypothetical protein